jgi:predicted DNA-binding transcriptional regulator AlpA
MTTAVADRDRLIDLNERSRITGEGRSTIYERIKAREVTVVKLGRRTLFSEAEAYAFVKAKLEAARSASTGPNPR